MLYANVWSNAPNGAERTTVTLKLPLQESIAEAMCQMYEVDTVDIQENGLKVVITFAWPFSGDTGVARMLEGYLGWYRWRPWHPHL